MSTFVNGLNFRRIFGDGQVKINVEQAVEMRNQRILEKEKDNSKESLINNMCDMKYNYDKSQCNPMKIGNANNLCTCWYIFNEFVNVEIQESMETDGNNEINLFNGTAMNRYHSYLNGHQPCGGGLSQSVSWDVFSNNDSVKRFICGLCESESAAEMIDEAALLKMSNEKWAMLRQYFDDLQTSCHGYLMKLVSALCRRWVSSFSMSTFDVAMLYGLHNAGDASTSRLEATRSKKNATGALRRPPIIFVVKYRSSIDLLLIPLLFKETGIDPPVYFVGESRQVLSMKAIVQKIGYVIVKDQCKLKYPNVQSFLVEKKAAMILESGRSICLVMSDCTNSHSSARGQQTEMRVLHSAVNAFIDGKLEEPLIVPLSLSHEFIPKEFRSRSNSACLFNSVGLMRALKWCTGGGGSFGIVKLSICKPVYYSQFSSNTENEESSTIADTERQVEKLVKHLSVFSDKCQLIMPTNLVAFMLLYHCKDRQYVSVQYLANIGHDLIKYILSPESLGFESTSVITTIRRGCNMLSHCISVSMDSSVGSDDCLLSVDWDSYSIMSELDLYADVIVHKILMKSVSAAAFVTESRLAHTAIYSSELTVSCDSMNNSVTNIVEIALSRFFQFLLPCESLDNELMKLNTWWNETMVSVTRETDCLHTDNESHNSKAMNWRADVYDPRVRDQILMMARCIAPRLETMNFIVMELMQHKQSGVESMILCSELYSKVAESIKTAGKSGLLRFKSCLNSDHFVSSIVTLGAHEMVRIFDIATKEWILKPENVDLLSSRYAILESEYHNLQRWKTFIDMSLLAV